MATTEQTFYITTPIFYPNANLHMGHAYSTTLSDIIARYHRLRGERVYFLTGADENTEKVVRAAVKDGKNTEEYLNDIISNFKSLFGKLEISYDQFIRTSDQDVHWPGAEELWKRIAAAGDLEKRAYEGLYCIGHESFITEKELVDGKCPDHDEKPELLKEENYFFKLSKYTGEIKGKIESGELRIIPETRRNEILALLERGLEDVSFSRPASKVTVGIPVPGDDTQRIYVWCDALANYISALDFGKGASELYEKFWPVDVHVIGKDILRFHAAIWPAMLLSAGLPLPKKIFVHGFITSGGKKMSKTLGNVIDPNDLISEYGAESVRYYLARHISPFEDGDLTIEKFKEAYNGELANGLGNLVSRVLKMSVTHGISVNVDKKFTFPIVYTESMDRFKVNEACDYIWKKIQETDQRIQEKQPFKLVKSDLEAAKAEIQYLLKEIYNIAELLAPILPSTSEKIKSLIKENKTPETPLFPRKE